MQLFFAHELLVPVRSEPRHAAELVNQLLWGEPVRACESSPDAEWLRIEGALDGYAGWARASMLSPMPQPEAAHFPLLRPGATLSVRPKSLGPSWVMHAPPGSRFPLPRAHAPTAGLELETAECVYETAEDSLLPVPTYAPAQVVQAAHQYIGVPYLWGGRSAWGIDCSGLVQVVYALAGVHLPRDAYQQAECGISVSPHHVQPADLAFFANAHGRITHVGIAIGKGLIVHASGEGRVRLDRLGPQGIYHAQRNTLTHPLATVRRVAPPA